MAHRDHLRFIAALIVLFILSVLLYTNSKKDDYLFGSMRFTRGDNLAKRVKTEDMLYQKTIEKRRELIGQWGPTAEDIVPLPAQQVPFTIWSFFPPTFRCPHRVDHVGTLADGGKWVCGLERIAAKKNCVVYSFGLHNESSFEADILKATSGCQVWGYDFGYTSFGPEVENESELKRRAHFFPYALGHIDAFDERYYPRLYSLRTLMHKNGHDFIDVLKMDVEGWEFDSLEVFINSFRGEPLPFGQLQVEFHVPKEGPLKPFWGFLKWWEKLESVGLRPFFSEPNLIRVVVTKGENVDVAEYSFINIRGSHELISDHPLPHRRISH